MQQNLQLSEVCNLVIFNSDEGKEGSGGGLGGIPDWLLRCIRQHGVWEGQEELACSDCDLCNQQAPSHSKHAISPQTEACFSTTHGFNWRLLLLLLLLLCLQLRRKKKNKKKQPSIARQTWLWNQWLANKSSGRCRLVVGISVVCWQKKWWLCTFLLISWEVFVSLCVRVCLCICLCVWTDLYLKCRSSANKASCLLLGWS